MSSSLINTKQVGMPLGPGLLRGLLQSVFISLYIPCLLRF